MFGLKSAQGRSILAGVMLIVLLAGVAIVAVWRAHDDQQQHHEMERTSATATDHPVALASRKAGRASMGSQAFSEPRRPELLGPASLSAPADW